jgi:uncharacterized protein (DUF433 family)
MVHERIEMQPEILLGKPVVRGTRIPVEGATEADLIDAHPRLTREDIRAALAFAADWLAHERIDLPRAG